MVMAVWRVGTAQAESDEGADRASRAEATTVRRAMGSAMDTAALRLAPAAASSLYGCSAYARCVCDQSVRRCSGGVYDLGLAVVWCPKCRCPVVGGLVAQCLDVLIRAGADERGWEIVALEVMPDHVHVFARHHPKDFASFVSKQFKGFSSRILREGFPHLRSKLPRLWSSSYFAASVAASAATMRRYIDIQRERPGGGIWGRGRDPRVQVPPAAYGASGAGLGRDVGRPPVAVQRRTAGTS
ncbi:IS200/IS605 family transposase [Catellatospora sp. NPDC049133]|uniref:IS200/IS605 family transposase n=1 Tax=Catellatospora sp. NPDC049133 TaxID=3155499 RepID=UPI0033F0704B